MSVEANEVWVCEDMEYSVELEYGVNLSRLECGVRCRIKCGKECKCAHSTNFSTYLP